MAESINDGRLRAVYLTKKSITDTANKLRSMMDRDVTKSDVSGLVLFMKELNYNLFADQDPDIVRELLAEKFADKLQSAHTGYVVDVKEMLKRSIGRLKVKDEPGDDVGTLFNRSTCPPSSMSDVKQPINITADQSDNPATILHQTYTSFTPNMGRRDGADGTPLDTRRDGYVVNNGDRKDVSNAKVIESIDNVANSFRLLRTIQDVYSAYILLDSRYRKIGGSRSANITEYKWEYTPTVYTTQGTANVVSHIQDVLYMQVMGGFYIPYVAEADNAYRRVTMLVQEFSALAVVAHEDRRYHYMLHSEVDGNRIRLNAPVSDHGKFRFSQPINRVDQITVSFGAPLTPITFQPDRYDVTIVPINPIETQLFFGTTTQHNVTNGEVVILSGYTTGDPEMDGLRIDEVNRKSGHVVTVVNPNTLSIAVDLTGITAPVPDPVVECYITTRRVLIHMRLVYAHKPAL